MMKAFHAVLKLANILFVHIPLAIQDLMALD